MLVAFCLCLLRVWWWFRWGVAACCWSLLVFSFVVLLICFDVGCGCLLNSVGFFDSLIVLFSLFDCAACLVGLCAGLLVWWCRFGLF